MQGTQRLAASATLPGVYMVGRCTVSVTSLSVSTTVRHLQVGVAEQLLERLQRAAAHHEPRRIVDETSCNPNIKHRVFPQPASARKVSGFESPLRHQPKKASKATPVHPNVTSDTAYASVHLPAIVIVMELRRQ